MHPLNIVGHSAKWDGLRRAFASGRVPQTLLISGPSHVGKWTLTRAWAQLLLCPNASENLIGSLPSPCLSCRVCHQIEVETFPDFRVVRPVINKTNPQRAPEALDSSAILVDDARRFVEEAGYRPTVGERKVMVIYQADRLGEEAQNTLLKTLEEPGTGVKIVLVTDRSLDLLPTIRSRCWQLRLGQAASRDIYNWLQPQFSSVPPDLLQHLVQSSGGKPGLAWRQASALAQDSPGPTRSEQVQALIESIRTSTPWGFLALSERAQKLAEAWGEEDAIAQADGDATSGADSKKLARTLVRSQLARFLDELAQGYRARWIGALVASKGREESGEAERWARGLDRIGKTRHYILRNANASLALDVLFSQLAPEPHAAPLNGRPSEAQPSQRVARR